MVETKGRLAGFTLVELMVTMAVLGILASMAAPSFSAWLARVRITSQTNELMGDISYARSESATRGANVTICVSSDGKTCTGTDWAAGRLAFVDTNSNGAFDPGETVLRVSGTFSGNTCATATGFPHAAYIQFRPYGGLNPPTSGQFKLCSTSVPDGTQVTVAVTGRPLATKVPCS